jgi:hypothetical protein
MSLQTNVDVMKKVAYENKILQKDEPKTYIEQRKQRKKLKLMCDVRPNLFRNCQDSLSGTYAKDSDKQLTACIMNI